MSLEKEVTVAQDKKPAPAYWIDHFVVGTNDMNGWFNWANTTIGVSKVSFGGLTTKTRKDNRAIHCFIFIGDGSCRFGAFLQKEELPPSKGLGKGTPRYGFFVRPEDIDEHLTRLERLGVPHKGPVRTREGGEEGAVIYFEDPDRNQYEFWAPTRMPAGAMEVATPLKVGRVSSAVYGARDLQRTAEFFSRFFSLSPASGGHTPEDTLVLPLAGGGRIIYKLMDKVDERTIGHRPWFSLHTALMVPDADFFPHYHVLWAGLPEWEDAEHKLDVSIEQEDNLPARTGLHTSPVGRKWKALHNRGDEFYDWDTHAFHLVGGASKRGDGSLATYISKDQGEKLKELVGDYGERPK